MNRRDLLKSFPSLPLFSLLADADLRKMYIELIFPSCFEIESKEAYGETYYNATLIDHQKNNEYRYSYNTKFEHHKCVILFVPYEAEEEDFEVFSVESTQEACEEIRKYLD